VKEIEQELLKILEKDHHILLDDQNNPEPHPKISDIYAIEALEDEYEEVYQDFMSYLIDKIGNIEEIRHRIEELNEKVENI
jgi:hypothetical protein